MQSLPRWPRRPDRRGRERLAGITAGWFFGANRAGEPMYDPATGVTFDGIAADGTINRNSGAESTIHGLLSMLALDENPRVRRIAENTTSIVRRDGLRVVEGESATGGGTVVTPASAWTGEAQFSGGKYLRLAPGQRASIELPDTGRRGSPRRSCGRRSSAEPSPVGRRAAAISAR